MRKLPAMTIEARDSRNAHGIAPPNNEEQYLLRQLDEAIILNQDALKGGWQSTTLDILEKYLGAYVDDVDGDEIARSVLEVTGHKSWTDASWFVQDDVCAEFFNLTLKYCLREQQAHRRDKDFIDGSGIGYLNVYLRRLKVTLEKAFDVKYFYKRPRPLQFALDHGHDLSLVANKIHPGHWDYVAGHGTKFLTDVEVKRSIFNLDGICSRTLIIAGMAESMARSGSLIHFPDANLAGGHLTELVEFG